MNKTDNYNREMEKRKKVHRTGYNIKTIDVFLESLLSESFPSLGVTVLLASLGCPTLY